MSNKTLHLAQSLANDSATSSDDFEHSEKMLEASKLLIIANNQPSLPTQPKIKSGSRLIAHLENRPPWFTKPFDAYWDGQSSSEVQNIAREQMAKNEMVINLIIQVKKSQ